MERHTIEQDKKMNELAKRRINEEDILKNNKQGHKSNTLSKVSGMSKPN